MWIAISAAGAFRTDDAGKTWKPINRGLKSQYIPDPNAEVTWGEQSWDEMMVGFFNLKFDGKMSPKELTAQEGAIHTH